LGSFEGLGSYPHVISLLPFGNPTSPWANVQRSAALRRSSAKGSTPGSSPQLGVSLAPTLSFSIITRFPFGLTFATAHRHRQVYWRGL